MQAENQGKNPYLEKKNPWSSHSLIKSFLSTVPKRARVLDVGIATGMIGRYCQELGLLVTGIEPIAEWADFARPYYQLVINATLDQTPDQFLVGYDIIILGDVLEHLPVPEASLKRLVNLQKKACVVIISVPNVANIWVRFNLMLGKFDYDDRGILDRTHLRFFTQKSITHLLEFAGLEEGKIMVTPIPLELSSNFYQCHPLGILIYKCLYIITRLMPSLFGYQFVIEAKTL